MPPAKTMCPLDAKYRLPRSTSPASCGNSNPSSAAVPPAPNPPRTIEDNGQRWLACHAPIRTWEIDGQSQSMSNHSSIYPRPSQNSKDVPIYTWKIVEVMSYITSVLDLRHPKIKPYIRYPSISYNTSLTLKTWKSKRSCERIGAVQTQVLKHMAHMDPYFFEGGYRERKRS